MLRKLLVSRGDMTSDALQHGKWDTPAPIYGQRPHTLAVPRELNNRGERLASFRFEEWTLEVIRGREVVWLLIRFSQRDGGVALRGVYSPDGDLEIEGVDQNEDGLTLQVNGTTMGRFRAKLTLLDVKAMHFRWEAWLTPAADLLMPPQPWNVYPIERFNDPTATRGIVYAAQRGTALACLFFGITEPQGGTCFYLQSLTSLNDYCEQTGTVPDSVVGNNWPGLGYLPPPSDRHPLEKGKEVSLCDAFIRLWPDTVENNRDCAKRFLDGIAKTYPLLNATPVVYRDWQTMATATVRDLTHSSKLWEEQNGYLYLHPYTASEYPDSMVQLSVVVGLREYEKWSGKTFAITHRLREAVPNFFDPKLGIMRRYLSTVGPDKEADKSDSWYVYHPLLNLGRLALDGDHSAAALFLRCMDYAIKVAHHFEYLWPVMFDLVTLETLTENRKPGEGGQTDVGGLYAYVMLQAFDLTKDDRFIEEAKAAIHSTAELGFTIGYQFNNVAWSAVACGRLFKLTGDRFFIDQAHVYLASFFHNVNLWECELGAARHYRTFMGVTCLHDGPYMAAYEEFEAYAAFDDLLRIAGDDLTAAAYLLVTEYCRHVLDRAWFYYPSSLPPDILAKEVRNGHIDRSLAIPLEDLYASRAAPGSVGQEVYGAGMAMTLLARSHYRLDGVPFILFCGYPLRDLEVSDRQLSFCVVGVPTLYAECRLLSDGIRPMPSLNIVVHRKDGKPISVETRSTFTVPGSSRVRVGWETME